MMTQSKVQLMEHVTSKHATGSFEACFPDFDAAPAGGAGGGAAGGAGGSGGYAPDKPIAEKKKKFKRKG